MARARFHLRCCWLALAVLSALGWGQAPEGSRGAASIAFQGYYMGGSLPLSDTTGVSVVYRNFIPGLGLLSANLESYGSQGNMRLGDNYVQLRGFVWNGRRWTFTGGDFKNTMQLVENPFTNLVTPEISVRGAKIEASNKNTTYTFFYGVETLQEGPRIPFRVKAPQRALGLQMLRKASDRLEWGIRLLRLDGSGDDERASLFFPENRRFGGVTSVTAQSRYKLWKNLKLYGEATLTAAGLKDTAATPGSSKPLSILAGPSWDSPRLTVRANYAYQGSSYLPLAGQYAGDRRGPYGEVRYRPWWRVELFASAARYTNNLENNPDAPHFGSTSSNAGFSFVLPGRINLSAQVAEVRLATRPAGESETNHNENRQFTVSMARNLGRHNLRTTLRDTLLDTQPQPDQRRIERQRSLEVEDLVTWKHWSAGGAVRYQTVAAEQIRSNFYARGSVQGHFGRFTVYAQMDRGQDIVNQTVFATSTVSTTVFGVSMPVRKGWHLQFEAFRNNLTNTLNPESIFALTSQGVAPAILFGQNQMSFFFRLTHNLHWGGPMPAPGELERYTIEQVPVTGAVEGFVSELLLDGMRRVEGIPVTLEGRQAVTDEEGRYRFTEVPEGAHTVKLSERELPADFNPGPVTQSPVVVDPKRVARADLQVIRLGQVEGQLIVPNTLKAEEFIIRLLPGERYTTPDGDGKYGFYNLKEGDYEIVFDEALLPEDAVLTDSPRRQVSLRIGKDAVIAPFEIKIQKKEKPVERLFEQKINVEQVGPDAPRPAVPQIPLIKEKQKQ